MTLITSAEAGALPLLDAGEWFILGSFAETYLCGFDSAQLDRFEAFSMAERA